MARKQSATKNQRMNESENGGTLPDAMRPATELPAQENAPITKKTNANQ